VLSFSEGVVLYFTGDAGGYCLVVI
jgi:hypothetical protein